MKRNLRKNLYVKLETRRKNISDHSLIFINYFWPFTDLECIYYFFLHFIINFEELVHTERGVKKWRGKKEDFSSQLILLQNIAETTNKIRFTRILFIQGSRIFHSSYFTLKIFDRVILKRLESFDIIRWNLPSFSTHSIHQN